jgi:rare lipoprotein A
MIHRPAHLKTKVSSVRFPGWLIPALLSLMLAACGTSGGGRYYQNDGPPRFGKGPDPASVPDAVPRNEPLSRTGNAPYTALGQHFTPMRDARGFRQQGYASWYGRQYHGNRTSSGEVYDMFAMTAAHPTLPLPSYVRVRNPSNGRQVVVKVNDRGPFLGGRVIDLSYMAARKLGVVESGVARVEIETVFAGEPPARVAVSRAPEAQSTPAVPLVSTASASAPADHATGVSYLLQAGSFASRGNAEQLAQRLRRSGYDNVRVARVYLSGRDYHRVQIGPYASRQSAEAMSSTLQQLLKSPVSVVVASAG